MLKSLFALSLLCSPLMMNADTTSKNTGFLLDANERGNYTLVGVDETLVNKEEIKIYYDENKLIDEVSDTAFATCTKLDTLVLSYSVTKISNATFVNSITSVKYTGSHEQYNQLGITKEFDELTYYASDEGFINYWNITVRPEKESNICGISTAEFNTIYGLYTDLTISERNIVDNTTDKANVKISDSMKVLINTFYQTPKPSNSGTTWNQKGALSFIIIVAVIGMTSICVFYLMKTKEIIE